VSIDSNKPNPNTRCLEKDLDQLSDEYQSFLLNVLETLNFAQNEREIIIEETEEANLVRNSE